eukprot:7282445-Pyramimonas_sp.AAC.1
MESSSVVVLFLNPPTIINGWADDAPDSAVGVDAPYVWPPALGRFGDFFPPAIPVGRGGSGMRRMPNTDR